MSMKKIALSILILFSMLSNALSQDISTNGEIYDFEVGDIFHSTSHFEAPDYEEDEVWNIQIIDKYEIQQPLQLIYVSDISKRSSVNGNPYEYIFYIDTVSTGYLNDLIHNGIIDTVYTSPDFYNGRVINTYEKWIDPYSVERQHWVNGCGRVYYYIWWGYDRVGWENELVYYKKGEEEWGTPSIIGIEENKGAFQNLLNYPNPFTTSTTLSYTLDKPSAVTISIFNPQGQLIEKIEQEQSKGEQSVQWNAERLPAGIYYFRLKAGDQVGGGKMVKM